MVALVLGNYVFAERVLFGRSPVNSFDDPRMIEIIFHACNFGASIITALFFWEKVQAYKLSTTSMKDQGVNPEIVQKANQGRGVVAMAVFSAFPLAYSCLPQFLLESTSFSIVFALALIAGSMKVYHLMKGVSRVLWTIYGMTPMALGISLLCCSGGGNTLISLHENYPIVLDRVQKESSFVISCVQMGFMLYYFHSRNLVTKRTVQTICKFYHITVTVVFLFRVERDLWLYFSTTSTNTYHENHLLPLPMLIQPLILSFAINAKLLSILLKKLWSGVQKATTKNFSSRSIITTTTALSTKQQGVQTSETTARRRSVSARVRSV